MDITVPGTSDRGYTLTPWQDDRTILTATGPDPAATLSAALSGLLAAWGANAGNEGEEATIALAIRAEGADVASLFVGLARALIEDLEHDEYDVRAARFDGLVRTDRGLAGWGYALAVPGEGRRPEVVVENVGVIPSTGLVTLRATVRRG